MNSRLTLANRFRTIARICSILVLLFGAPFLLFVGLQLLSGEAATLSIFLSLILLTGLLAGLVIAWRNEGLGTAIALVSLVGSFSLSRSSLPGVGSRQGFSFFAGPINLLFALLMPGYHPDVSPTAKLVPVISWALPIVPIMLFIASWFIRRKSPELNSAEEISTKGE